MSDLAASQQAAAAASSTTNPGPSPVPSPTSNLTTAHILAVNGDGTLSVDLGDGTPVNLYAFATFVPVVDMDVKVMTDAGGVQYVLGPVRSGTVVSATETAYPVGRIYISTDSTNPADVLGFGTWSAFAPGRTMIGVGTSDASYSAGATGGQSLFGIDASHLPVTSPWSATQVSHFHGPSDGDNFVTTGTNNAGVGPGSIGGQVAFTTAVAPLITMGSNSSGGNSVPTVPPYIVTYMFQRTA